MSVDTIAGLPTGDAPARAQAKETLWRLTALAAGHPSVEVFQAVSGGDFQEAFGQAWTSLTGRPWVAPKPVESFKAFEAGYIWAFLHGHKGRPVAPLLAGDYEVLLGGLTRPVFMLNLSAFYRHFGLKAAVDDEGFNDEPDHLATMAEFMAVLCHLEARALADNRDPAAYRRAQRDFLSRYLASFLERVVHRLGREETGLLSPDIRAVFVEMATWSAAQIAELEARVGPFRDPDKNPTHGSMPAAQAGNTSAPQNLWG